MKMIHIHTVDEVKKIDWEKVASAFFPGGTTWMAWKRIIQQREAEKYTIAEDGSTQLVTPEPIVSRVCATHDAMYSRHGGRLIGFVSMSDETHRMVIEYHPAEGELSLLAHNIVAFDGTYVVINEES